MRMRNKTMRMNKNTVNEIVALVVAGLTGRRGALRSPFPPKYKRPRCARAVVNKSVWQQNIGSGLTGAPHTGAQ
eukprot:13481873-Heterocapsa_arctica.AAC.1